MKATTYKLFSSRRPPKQKQPLNRDMTHSVVCIYSHNQLGVASIISISPASKSRRSNSIPTLLSPKQHAYSLRGGDQGPGGSHNLPCSTNIPGSEKTRHAALMLTSPACIRLMSYSYSPFFLEPIVASTSNRKGGLFFTACYAAGELAPPPQIGYLNCFSLSPFRIPRSSTQLHSTPGFSASVMLHHVTQRSNLWKSRFSRQYL